MTVTLYCGDCLELLPTLEAQSIDAIITDLPYGTTACKWDEVIPFAPMWEQVRRVLKPRGVFVTTASQPFTSALVMSNPEWFRCEWIWDKAYVTGHLNARRQPMKQHESILVFGQKSSVYNPQLEVLSNVDKRYRKNGRGREKQIESVYQEKQLLHHAETGTRFPKTILRSLMFRHATEHPTQKPVALYEYLIRTYTNEGDTVLDFTCGSGTTGVACLKTGRNFIGVELDEGYFKVAQRRIEQAQMQLPLLEAK